MSQQELHTEDLTAVRPEGSAAAPAPPGAPVDVRATEAGSSLPRPEGGSATAPAPGVDAAGGWGELLGDTRDLAARWDAVQAGFVDEPRRAVEEADALVAQVIQRLAEGFAAERSQLEAQWSQGSQVSTEDLRVALRRYRSFFNRLLLRPERAG